MNRSRIHVLRAVARGQRRSFLLAALAAAAGWATPSTAFAQSDPKPQNPPAQRASPAPSPSSEQPQTATAVRSEQPPKIDGLLDDPVWTKATRVDRFVQERPVEGDPASEKTDVWIAYDSQALYFGIHAHYSDTSLIRANRVDRDKTENDDTVAVYFDPFLDRQRAYSMTVNGYGVQGDVILSGRDATADRSWDALFASAGRLVDDGWTAEIAIPFKSLRYPARGRGQAHRWGFQIQRVIQSKNESVVWSPISTNVTGALLAQMGVLDGMSDLSTSHNFELMPTVTAVQAGSLRGSAFTTDHVEEGGVNVKYGITSNMTFDFTFNPDFSQVESDRQQIEVNQRFPIQYPELRPFFLEGQEIYNIPGFVRPLHTRTIVDPRYGAKLSGKLGKTAIGVLVADDEAPGKLDDPGNPAYHRSAKVVVARAKYDLWPNSYVGAIVTDREFLEQYSRLTGLDSVLRFGPNHTLTVRTFYSDRQDPTAGRRTGEGVDLSFRKQGRSLRYSLIHNRFSPQFGNDLSFIRRVDQKNWNGSIDYRWWPESWIINWGPGVSYVILHDFAGVLQNEESGASVTFDFAKSISFTANLDRVMERYRSVSFDKTRLSFSGKVNTSRRILVSASFNRGDEIRFVSNPFLGRTTVSSVSITLRPSSRVQSAITIDTTRFLDVRTNTTAFDIKILRALTTYQFTDRLVVRNILDRNTFDRTFGANLLLTYRVNAGTVFFVGYDDRYRQGDMISPTAFPTTDYRRTNRAVFTKLQYLFRKQ